MQLDQQRGFLPQERRLLHDGVEPRFKTLNRIGHGAFGEVFRARDLLSGEIVALKRIFVKQPQRGVGRSASNEVAVLQAVSNPHVMHLMDVHRQCGYLTLVMEYCAGDLGTVLSKRQGKGFSHETAACLMKQIMKGLAALHAKGIMHRDLKPSNVLLTKDGCAKIADFGQSRFIDVERGRWYWMALPGASHMTVSNGVVPSRHTPTVTSRWYRSPELLYASCSYDMSIDVWAAALIFAELLNGQALLRGESDLDQIARMFEALGSIDEHDWPEVKQLPDYGKIMFDAVNRSPLQSLIPHAHPHALEFLEKTLQYNPSKRMSAKACLELPLFQNLPDCCDPSVLFQSSR